MAIVLLLLALFGLTVFWTPHASSGPAGDKLYWTDYGDQKILRANLDGTGVEDVITNIDARDLAIDSAGGKMYWTNIAQRKIQRANLNGTQIEDLVTLIGLAQPRGIALDLVAGKVYWADHNLHIVQRADLDGENVETFAPAFNAGSVTVNGIDGKVYWSQDGGIWRANLDGTGEEALIGTLFWSPDLALDLVGGHIYYVDTFIIGGPLFFEGVALLARRNLDGSGYQEVDESGCILGITVDEVSGGVFWTTNVEFVWCAPGFASVVGPGFSLPANRPWGIAIARDAPAVILPTPTPGPTNTPGPVGGISADETLAALPAQTSDVAPTSYVVAGIVMGIAAACAAALGAVSYIRKRPA